MSFSDPLWLLALLLVPAVVAWQLLARRRRTTRYAIRFTAVSTVREVVQTSGRWAARIAAVALLLAIAVAAVALARPRIPHRVPIGQASLLLVLDHSGSMAATDVDPSRLRAAIHAANTFIDQLPKTARVGVIGFADSSDYVQRPTIHHSVVRAVIDRQVASGGTATGPALELALRLLHGSVKHHPPSAIVLLSDGAANVGVNPVVPAQQARQDKIPIYTVALGTPDGVLNLGPFSRPEPVPPDPELMRAIAQESGGRTFNAKSAGQLSSIYSSLGQQLSTVKRHTDITAEVALAAAALLLIAVVVSRRSLVPLP